MHNLSDPDSLENAAAPTQEARPVTWFTVPVKLARQTGVYALGLVELASGEEIIASKRAQGEPIKAAFELAKESLRRVKTSPQGDVQLLSTADLSADSWWAQARPGMSKLRQLCLAAHGQVHNPRQEDLADFLGSAETSIG